MSGSGSNLSFNASSEDTFNCRLSSLSSDNITDTVLWSIGDNLQVGATIAGVLILIFFIMGLVWNLFIIITFFTKHELLKEPANVFLVNLALTDLLICLTTMVFSFVTAFGQEFIFGSNDTTRCTICGMSGFFLVFVIMVSLHLLMALSIDRFILLSHPLRYKSLMNRWKALIICLAIYIFCFVLAVLPLAGIGEYEFNGRFASCVPRFTPLRNFLYVAVLAVEALIPIFILAITNVWTFRLVSKFLKRNFHRRSTFRRQVRQEERDEGQKHHKQQTQLVKVFSALFVANIITYTPTITTIFIFLILTLTGNDPTIIPSEVYIFGFVSFLTNSVFHPIIQSFFVKELRYQVNRAKKGVRRVSSTLIRQTTQLFTKQTLDEAAKKADDENAPRPKRAIHFLNGRVASKTMNDSMVTDCVELSVNPSLSSTPEPHIVPGELGEEKGNATTGNGVNHRDVVMLDKTRRSVTFQEGASVTDKSRAMSSSSSSSSVGDGPRSRLESCLKLASIDPIHEEDTADERDAGLGTMIEQSDDAVPCNSGGSGGGPGESLDGEWTAEPERSITIV